MSKSIRRAKEHTTRVSKMFTKKGESKKEYCLDEELLESVAQLQTNIYGSPVEVITDRTLEEQEREKKHRLRELRRERRKKKKEGKKK